MNSAFEDDELIRAAYEVPDLQVSELKKDDGDQFFRTDNGRSLEHFQLKSKFESFFRFKGCLGKFQRRVKKYLQNRLNRGFYRWKILNFERRFQMENFAIKGKWEKIIKNFQSFLNFKIRKSFQNWRIFAEEKKICEEFFNKKSGVLKNIKKKNKSIEGLDLRIKYLEDAVNECKYSENEYNKNLALLKDSHQKSSKVDDSNTKILKSLLKENENLREKMNQIKEIYDFFLIDMDSSFNNKIFS